jgi:hypothetical protein
MGHNETYFETDEKADMRQIMRQTNEIASKADNEKDEGDIS